MQAEGRLVQRVQQGDRRAFEELVDGYGARVHSLVRRYVDNPSDAEDVTQEIFVDIFRGLGSFRGEAALSTWIYRLSLNHCLRYRERVGPACVPLDDAALPSRDGADPMGAAVVGELRDRVSGALQGLTPDHRDVVILHELQGLTYQECAQVLEVPVGTVKSRLSNAFRRLRDSLGGYVLGEGAALQPGAIGESSR